MQNDPRWLLGTIVERRGPLSYLVQVPMGWCGGDMWTVFEEPLIVYRRKKLLFQRLLMNLKLRHPYNLTKIHQLFTQMKEVLLFLLPMIRFLSLQKDQRLLLCQLRSLSLTLHPHLLDATLNVFADNPNDFMNNSYM